MNVDLLLRVKKHIQQKPSRLRMSQFLVRKENLAATAIRPDNRIVKIKGKEYFNFLAIEWGEPSKQKIPDCGTVGCIAGWTCMLGLDTPPESVLKIKQSAINLLQLDNYQAEHLFYVHNWPTELRDGYYEAKNNRQRARIVGKVIDLFIKSKGNFS